MKSKDKERQYESKEVWFRVVPNAEYGGGYDSYPSISFFKKQIEGIVYIYGFKIEIFWYPEFRDTGFGLEQKTIIYSNSSEEIDEFLKTVDKLLKIQRGGLKWTNFIYIK